MTRAPSLRSGGAAARPRRSDGGEARPRGRAVPAAAVPAMLAAAAIAGQVAYPLVDGSARHRLTVAVVVAFAGASLTHAAASRGWGFAVRLLVVAGGVGAAVEVIGLSTGWPFGAYRYAGDLGPAVAGVPAVIPLAWTMMAYPALVVARHITRRPVAGVVLAAWALTAWDLFLDPQMVAHGQWEWAAGGSYLGVPATNYAGWLATSLVIAAALWPAADRAESRRDAGDTSRHGEVGTRGSDPVPRRRRNAVPRRRSNAVPRRRGDAVPVVLYAWTWLGSVVAHAAFFDLGLSAAVGGVGMGAVMGAWVVSAWPTGTRRG